MSYLIDTTNLKKKFCNHDFKILYPHGSKEPVNVCIKCKLTKNLKIKNEQLIRYMVPASEPSEPDYFEEHQFLTNWNIVWHDGWHLSGTKDPHDWCGLWQTRGCLNVEGHKNSNHNGEIYVRTYQRSCYRADCKECFRWWIRRQANRSTSRIAQYEIQSEKNAIHIILSVSDWDYGLSFKEQKKKALSILKEIGCLGGVIIYHPFRFNKKLRQFYYSPHFHIVGFGKTVGVGESFHKNGWLIKNKGFRESVFQTFYYLLSHCGIKKGSHSLTWFGDLSYSKLKIEKEPDYNICPACGKKLVPIYSESPDPLIPPDKIFEGFVDSEGWYEVKSTPEYDVKEYYQFDYAPIRDVNEVLKGLAEAS
jgi:hypothetical protein